MAFNKGNHDELPLPAKHLGQHFLTDDAIALKIVGALDHDLLSTLPVLEIGPGRMILTRHLLDKTSKLILIEKDSRLIPLLEHALAPMSSKVEIRFSDAMDDPFNLWDFPYLLVSNLPYNVSVPLLVKALSAPHPPLQSVLMFQKEVGERIVAPTGGKSYGSLSVAIALLSHAKTLFNVRPGSFSPPPKVQSMVLSFTPSEMRKDPAVPGALYLSRAAFTYRRKTLKNAFVNSLDPDTLRAMEPLYEETPEIKTMRPEQIAPEEWLKMSRSLLAHKPGIFDRIEK